MLGSVVVSYKKMDLRVSTTSSIGGASLEDCNFSPVFLQFQFSVGRGSAAIFGHATFQSFQKVQKAEKYDGVVTTHSLMGP